jgi:hypothetical protein
MRKVGAGGRKKTEEDTMAKLALTVIIFTALMTGVATGAQNDAGTSPRSSASLRRGVFPIGVI